MTTADVVTGDVDVDDVNEKITDTGILDSVTTDENTNEPDKMTGIPEKMTSTPEKMTGTPDKINSTLEKMTGTHDKMTGTQDKMTGTPDKMTGTSDNETTDLGTSVDLVLDGLGNIILTTYVHS